MSHTSHQGGAGHRGGRPHGLRRYGVLRGKATESKLAGAAEKPHYQIHVRAAEEDHRIAVNVLSDTQPADLLFFLDPDFRHPVTGLFEGLAEGYSQLDHKAGGAAIDFIRGNLFDPEQMQIVPPDRSAEGPGAPANDLHEIFDLYVHRAIRRNADLYAFGSKWGPEDGKADPYFGFEPGNGIHDIHMNQGSAPPPLTPHLRRR